MSTTSLPAALAPAALLNGASSGLRVRDGLALDDWVELGCRIATIANASGWWLGDWLLYGQHSYGNRYKTALRATDLDYQTLRNCAWVAHKFDMSRRRATLSFNHHAEVAALSEAEQDLWLRRADRFGWSRNELRRQVSAARRLRQDETNGDAVTLTVPVTNDRDQRWRDAAAASGQSLSEWIACVVDAAAEALLLEPAHASTACVTIDDGP